MALLKYGPIVSEARGKLNGVVLSRNQYGAYARAVGTLVDPETSFQLAQRANLIEASQAWRLLTNQQRAAWYSATMQHKRSNIFGDASNLSGFNYFVKLYLRAKLIRVTPPTDARVNTPATNHESIAPASLTTLPDFSFTMQPSEVPVGETGVLEAAIDVSAGRIFVKNHWRFICLVTERDNWGDNFAAEVEARLGRMVEGNRACIRVRHIHNVSLQASTRVHSSDIITGL